METISNNSYVFDIANEVNPIVRASQPSRYIPFKGSFPLLADWQAEEYYHQVTDTRKRMKDIPIWCQDIIVKALKIRNIESGFIDYLTENGIIDNWFNLTSKQRAHHLVVFLDTSSMTTKYLNI